MRKSILIAVSFAVAALFVTTFGKRVGALDDMKCTGKQNGCDKGSGPQVAACYSPAEFMTSYSCEMTSVFAMKICETGIGTCSNNQADVCGKSVYFLGGGCNEGSCDGFEAGTEEFFKLVCEKRNAGGPL